MPILLRLLLPHSSIRVNGVFVFSMCCLHSVKHRCFSVKHLRKSIKFVIEAQQTSNDVSHLYQQCKHASVVIATLRRIRISFVIFASGSPYLSILGNVPTMMLVHKNIRGCFLRIVLFPIAGSDEIRSEFSELKRIVRFNAGRRRRKRRRVLRTRENYEEMINREKYS